MIQTQFPEHPLLNRLVTEGYESFAASALQERRENQVRPEQSNRLACNVLMDIDLDRQLMAILLQLNVEPLRQAIEGVDE